MFINIQLIDDEDRVHSERKLEVQLDTSINQLKTSIWAYFCCDEDDQILMHQNGDLITETMKKIEEASITPGATINVKHKDLHLWTMYKELVLIKNFRTEEEKREKALEVDRVDTLLIESRLLLAYSEFDDYRDKHSVKFIGYLDPIRLMKLSAAMYFKSLYSSDGDERNSSNRRYKCRFKQVPLSMRGSHDNIFAFVYPQNSNGRRKFVLKTHCLGPYSYLSRRKQRGVDINELFALKALEFMGLGPKVHFIPLKLPEDSDEFRYLYIASEFRPDFCRLADMKQIDPEVAIQLLLIKEIFFLRDVHLDNCGSWTNTSTAAIVDLSIDEEEHRDIFSNIQDCYPSEDWAEQFDDVIKRPDPYLYSLVEYYLNLWDIDSIIDKAFKETEAVICILEQHNTTFRWKNPSQLLNTCVEEIHISLQMLRTNLEKHNSIHTKLSI